MGRRSDWWIGIGATLLGAAFASVYVVVVVGLVTLPDYAPARQVAATSRVTVLAVEPHEQYVVLAHEGAGYCAFSDGLTHVPLGQLPVAASVDAHTDAAGSWRALTRFVSSGTSADVLCVPDTAIEVAAFHPPTPLTSARHQWRYLLGSLGLGLVGAATTAAALWRRLRPRPA